MVVMDKTISVEESNGKPVTVNAENGSNVTVNVNVRNYSYPEWFDAELARYTVEALKIICQKQ